jgi:hypothetical protein
MNENVYFDGDPGTDSTRRHMERVLKTPEPARRWPWLLAALGGGGVWLLWHLGATARAKDSSAAEPQRSAAADGTTSDQRP